MHWDRTVKLLDLHLERNSLSFAWSYCPEMCGASFCQRKIVGTDIFLFWAGRRIRGKLFQKHFCYHSYLPAHRCCRRRWRGHRIFFSCPSCSIPTFRLYYLLTFLMTYGCGFRTYLTCPPHLSSWPTWPTHTSNLPITWRNLRSQDTLLLVAVCWSPPDQRTVLKKREEIE